MNDFKLIVQTNDRKFVADPNGFVASTEERYVAQIERICRANHIPYSSEFVSLHVKKPKPLRFKVPEGRTLHRHQTVHAFGNLEIELSLEIVSELVLVCAGDFQTIIINSEGRGPEYLNERICVLEGKSVEEKMNLLSEFADKARRFIVNGYAEARLFRALKSTDTQQPLDDEGKE